MNINHITNLEAITKSVDPSSLVRSSKLKSDSAEFADYSHLQAALKNQTDVRQDKLDALESKNSSLIYPPQELIQGISKLIAEQMTEPKHSNQ